MKFKIFFIFFKRSILTSNNVIWVGLLAILFNEAQHFVKISTTGYVPVFYEVINLFIKPQNFLLMFFICKFKGLYLIVFFFDDLLMLSLGLFNFYIKSAWYDVFQDMLFKCFALGLFAFNYDIHDPKEREEFIRLVLMILRPRPASRTMGTAFMSFLVSISHLSRPVTNVSMCLRFKDFPTWALLNQFYSSLSTTTSISLRLNSSGLLPASSETFNTEDIFYYNLGSGEVTFAFRSKLSQKCIKNFAIMA